MRSHYLELNVDSLMKDKKLEAKQASTPTKQVLVFSTRLRQDIQTACRQLENGEGQEDVTINKEVKSWLNK